MFLRRREWEDTSASSGGWEQVYLFVSRGTVCVLTGMHDAWWGRNVGKAKCLGADAKKRFFDSVPISLFLSTVRLGEDYVKAKGDMEKVKRWVDAPYV